MCSVHNIIIILNGSMWGVGVVAEGVVTAIRERPGNRWQRDVTPKRYRYVTRATAKTECRVGQECSSTQGLYRLCGQHPLNTTLAGHLCPPLLRVDATGDDGGLPTSGARQVHLIYTHTHNHRLCRPRSRENFPIVKSVNKILLL